MGEKDRPRSADSHQGTLFTKMRAIARNQGVFCNPADPRRALKALRQALPRANAARLEQLFGRRGPLLEFPCPVKVKIRWPEHDVSPATSYHQWEGASTALPHSG